MRRVVLGFSPPFLRSRSRGRASTDRVLGRVPHALLGCCAVCWLLSGCDSNRAGTALSDASLDRSESGVSGADGSSSDGGPGSEVHHCKEWNSERLPFFGDLHVHTALSLDANLQGTRLRPRDAYRFARGERVDLPPYDDHGNARRTLQLERPLDFVAVSDHAEFLGLVNTCVTPGSDGYDSFECSSYRDTSDIAFFALNGRLAAQPANAHHEAPCTEDNEFCGSAALGAWQEIKDAAEQANDGSSECSFTAYVAYEWSGSPDTKNLHRNVIFRGSSVPELPFSYFDGSHPEQLWQSLTGSCLDASPCDVLTIPHNSNLSAGLMFEPVQQGGAPFDADYAAKRAQMEPLAEIFQHKGSSECLPELGPDELCSFELMPYNTLGSTALGGSGAKLLARDQLRDALGQGLLYQQRLGVNPFAYGVVASTDTHVGTPGAVEENKFQGHGGAGSKASQAAGLVDKVWLNPGGLAVLWAEENSRDALFEAMRRREAYGTSGPRITLRFFAGADLPEDMCQRADFVAQGYQNGVPMGGVLEGDSRAPRLFVRAERDPGTEQTTGGLLERLQVVKGWVQDGKVEYKIIDVAGLAGRATVDEASCTPQGAGDEALCANFLDPDFRPDAQAFYYARVLENPSCRWHQHACLAAGVRCEAPRNVPNGYQDCCGSYPKVHQERAWSSPVFYRPGS